MYDLDTIKKVNGEFPPDGEDPSQPLTIEAFDGDAELRTIRLKAARYDEYMTELRSAPLRIQQRGF